MATESPTTEVTALNHIVAHRSADLSSVHPEITLPGFLCMVVYNRMLVLPV